jgi:hypothetical protein
MRETLTLYYFMKNRQILLLSYYSIYNKTMHDIKTNRKNSIRIEGFPRVNIRKVGKLISRVEYVITVLSIFLTIVL